ETGSGAESGFRHNVVFTETGGVDARDRNRVTRIQVRQNVTDNILGLVDFLRVASGSVDQHVDATRRRPSRTAARGQCKQGRADNQYRENKLQGMAFMHVTPPACAGSCSCRYSS